MRSRTILSCMIAAGTIAGVSAVGVSPAEAQTIPRNEQMAGNFFGDAREEQFWYFEGSAPDALYSLSNGGQSGGILNITPVEYSINGSYRPFTGDFDGDGYDELFWYAPGPAPDYIWHFYDSRHYRQQRVTVNGTYTPLSGDFNGDGNDDVMWYAPGTAPDTMWLNRRGDASPVSLPLSVSGNYRAFVASIGKDNTDDIVWYAPGTAADYVWDWTRLARTHTTFRITVNGSYQPVAFDSYGEGWRSDDIWWYAPGSAPDPFWDYVDGVVADPTQQLPVVGNYEVNTGDFFGDGIEDLDLVNLAGCREVIRDFTFDGGFGWYEYVVDLCVGAASSSGELGSKSAGAGELQPRER